jgi:Flp pilus assembly protein TadD
LLGVAAAEQGRLEVAVALIGQAIALRGDVPEYYRNLSTALRAMGEVQAAIGCLREGARRCPGDGVLQRQLAEALSECGDWSGALPFYREAVQLEPADGLALKGLGAALVACGLAQAAAQRPEDSEL